jgi:hypothetical protein
MRPTHSYARWGLTTTLLLTGALCVAAQGWISGADASVQSSHLLWVEARFLLMEGAYLWVALRAIGRMRAAVERI